jgi:hypothetical protein
MAWNESKITKIEIKRKSYFVISKAENKKQYPIDSVSIQNG